MAEPGAWETFLDAVPLLNTWIVAVVGLLILYGWHQIRRGRVARHRRTMLTATALFALFLVLYVVRLVAEGPTPFAEQNPTAPGWARYGYYTFLGIHMVLALVTVVLLPVVLVRGLRSAWVAHRRLARVVAPLWLVSIAMGIGVYFLLYRVWGS